MASELTPKQKTELLKVLSGNNFGMSLMYGSSNITSANLITQIQTMEKPDITEVLSAIANRLSKQP